MELSTWLAFIVAGILISASPGAVASGVLATFKRHA